MFDETPNDSRHDADLFDFCEFPHPGAGGLSETPAEIGIERTPVLAGLVESLMLNRSIGEAATDIELSVLGHRG